MLKLVVFTVAPESSIAGTLQYVPSKRYSYQRLLIQANSLINSMLEDNTIDQLGALVLDEMHMIGDAHRGYIMELVVTKVLAIQLPVQVNICWINAHVRSLECRRQ
jgi:hypothetical protein